MSWVASSLIAEGVIYCVYNINATAGGSDIRIGNENVKSAKIHVVILANLAQIGRK